MLCFLGLLVRATLNTHAAHLLKAPEAFLAALTPEQQTPNAHLRETLKPNTLSNSFMSFFSRVLFPAPDGPVSTTGLGPAIAEGVRETHRGDGSAEATSGCGESLGNKPSEILWHES